MLANQPNTRRQPCAKVHALPLIMPYSPPHSIILFISASSSLFSPASIVNVLAALEALILLSKNTLHTPSAPDPLHSPVAIAMECSIPIASATGQTAYFDLTNAVPGALLRPAVFDSEIWTPKSEQHIEWLYYKGDPTSGPQSGHEWDVPFASNTAFKIDLLRSDSSVLQNVMLATTVSPFGNGSKLDGVYGFQHKYLRNKSCVTNAYGMLSYKWMVPETLDMEPTYHLQLSTNDSEVLYFSGGFRVGSGCQQMRRVGGISEAFALLGVVAFGLLILGHFLTKRRSLREQYETVDGDEKEPLMEVHEEKIANVKAIDSTV